MTSTVHTLQDQFRHLRMVETANELPELLRNAERSSWTYRSEERRVGKECGS